MNRKKVKILTMIALILTVATSSLFAAYKAGYCFKADCNCHRYDGCDFFDIVTLKSLFFEPNTENNIYSVDLKKIRKTCSTCKGTGKSPWAKDYPPAYGGERVSEWCSICNDYTYIHTHRTCPTCRGTGSVEEYDYSSSSSSSSSSSNSYIPSTGNSNYDYCMQQYQYCLNQAAEYDRMALNALSQNDINSYNIYVNGAMSFRQTAQGWFDLAISAMY